MSDYKCATCGRSGCKLWREYSPIGQAAPLLCCDCAAKVEGKDVGQIDADGRVPGSHGGRTDQIGYYIPAVPHPDGFWPYSLVPEDRAAWWRSLPTRPLEVSQ
jgi:hypothetical protein